MAEAHGPVVVMSWSVQGGTGWGLFGLHLGLALDRVGVRVGVGGGIDGRLIPATLRPSMQRWARRPEDDGADIVLLTGLSNNFEGVPAVETTGSIRHVGLAIFEDPVVDEKAVERLRGFDALITPSQWCHDVLAAKGLESTVIHQGFDGSVWHPAPRRRSDDRLLVFCGGKLEYRKGQDIMVEAFKRFLKTPEGKDAVLVTQWVNPWPQTMEGIWAKGYVRGVPNQTIHGWDMEGWTAANGIPEGAHVDLGMVSNTDAANAIRECDVAVFPSRAEGATNMVLTECMAVGLPCIVAQNTGQRDLPRGTILPLERQGSVTSSCKLYRGFDGWGESDPDEIVASLMFVREKRHSAKAFGDEATLAMQDWTWAATVDQWRAVLGV